MTRINLLIECNEIPNFTQSDKAIVNGVEVKLVSVINVDKNITCRFTPEESEKIIAVAKENNVTPAELIKAVLKEICDRQL